MKDSGHVDHQKEGFGEEDLKRLIQQVGQNYVLLLSS